MLDFDRAILYQDGHQLQYLDEEDEWRCSECGRIIKFIDGKKVVIVPGNEFIIHTNYRGLTSFGIRIE